MKEKEIDRKRYDCSYFLNEISPDPLCVLLISQCKCFLQGTSSASDIYLLTFGYLVLVLRSCRWRLRMRVSNTWIFMDEFFFLRWGLAGEFVSMYIPNAVMTSSFVMTWLKDHWNLLMHWKCMLTLLQLLEKKFLENNSKVLPTIWLVYLTWPQITLSKQI